MSAGSAWRLVGFQEHASSLGYDLPPAVAEAFAHWLVTLRHNPFEVHHVVIDSGTYLGDPEIGEDRQMPFPPKLVAWIAASFTGEALSCAFLVDPDTRTVTCTGLNYCPPADEWRV